MEDVYEEVVGYIFGCNVLLDSSVHFVQHHPADKYE
jgi:hypothetical protein